MTYQKKIINGIKGAMITQSDLAPLRKIMQ